jgi:mono/diheme cytochrome c family protein
MKRLSFLVVTALVLGAVPPMKIAYSQQPQLRGNPDEGERLARRWCVACHVVAANQRQVAGEAPPFATIASRPDFDAGKLALFLLDPHPKMPDMGLSRLEAADLAAYIASLAK